VADGVSGPHSGRRARRRDALPLYSVAGFLVLFGTWFAFAHSGWVPRLVLPSVETVATTFWRLTQDPFAGFTLQQHLLSSAIRFGSGFALAAAIGIPLGLMTGWFRWLDDIV
jgi:ABC-type nitrate/sulfonate/bicarbonate transport system permease component